MHPISIENVTNLVFKMEGNILASKDIDQWPVVDK